jgi:glycosyltransferase involved in cell wall biosynthesis
MSTAPRYSIAVCNYNMVETLADSLRSMADQVDPDRYEVVVVDGGSSDGSRDVLRDLEAEYPHLRAVLDRSDECDWLGGDRNVSFEESRGEYVLESLDTDDYYLDGVIEEFVEIFHGVESGREEPFFLSGRGINVAPRSLLLEVPYRDLGGAEDRDLWRRLFARDALVWLDHGPVARSLGYDPGLRGQVSRDLHGKVTDFRTGVDFASAVRYTLHHEHHYVLERERPLPLEVAKRLYDLVTYPYAYWRARSFERHEAPPEFREKGSLERRIVEAMRTLPELEAEYGFAVDCESFGEAGRRAYCEYAAPGRS